MHSTIQPGEVCVSCGKPATHYFNQAALTAASGVAIFNNDYKGQPYCGLHGAYVFIGREVVFGATHHDQGARQPAMPAKRDTPSDATDAAKALEALRHVRLALYDMKGAPPFIINSYVDNTQILEDAIRSAERQVAELAAVRERERRMRAVLRLFAPEQTGHIGSVCSACHMFVQSDIGHTEDCAIGQARTLLAEAEAGDGA